MPLLLVGMMRPVPQRDDLLALQRVAGEAAWLELSALGEAAVADLVAALAGGRPDSSLLRLADGSIMRTCPDGFVLSSRLPLAKVSFGA